MFDFSSFVNQTSSFFLQTIFEKEASTTFTDSLEQIIKDEFLAICRNFDFTQIQDSWSWRNTHVARELANILIDDRGQINKRLLLRAIHLLEENIFSLGPKRHHDCARQQHLIKNLKHLYELPSFALALQSIRKPSGNSLIERVIRATLFISQEIKLTDTHARRAALSALLTSLRQNVGSCFATAPAILIKQDQPLNFLEDIRQLFGNGRLTRTYEGIEYTVPLSISWGVGDLFRPILLSSFGDHPLQVLSLSPGLLAAFESVGLIDNSLQDKKKGCEKLLKASMLNFNEEKNSFSSITPDQLIKAVLLHNFKITEKEVVDFCERSVQGPFSEFVIRSVPTREDKSLVCNRYLKAYETAKEAFKALTDNALLKAWEFTLASLSESKADCAKWNLYISLGVQPEDEHGIGNSLYSVIQDKISKINEEIAELQSRYEHLFAQAKYLEGRMSNISTEREASWIQSEYQIRRHEINQALGERDAVYEKGKKLQQLYPLLIDFYGKKIREYFQEVYDAEMHDISTNPYDDSPAGFRLVYKHGRTNTALWTQINSATEYIQHLTSFFISTEIELNRLPQFEGLQKEISELITAAIMTIKRTDFLESSFVRLAKAYKEPLIRDPLQNLNEVERKPWAYVSGGTMTTLTSCYWGNPQSPREVKRWVESENELLAFLIDSIKECPLTIKQKYQQDANLSMLAFSPTHAFLCKPGWKLYRKAWESDIYTYTWIRDYWISAQKKFLDSQMLDSRMMDIVLHQLLFFIPAGYRAIVKSAVKHFSYSMTPPEFREHVIKTLSYEKWLKGGRKLDLITEELDCILYRFLPLFPEHALKERLVMLFEAVDDLDEILKKELHFFCEKAEENIGKYKILTAEDLKNIAKGLLILSLKTTRSSIFYHQKIIEAMQKAGLRYPEPFLFADTNWVKNVFGFIINPGNRQLEFWRFDECGSEGRPMTQWKRYLNGIEKKEWGLYISPQQYGQ